MLRPQHQFGTRRSGKNCLDDFAAHIGETTISALEEVRQFFVIETEQAQQGGVEVMDMNLVFNGFVPEIICRAIT